MEIITIFDTFYTKDGKLVIGGTNEKMNQLDDEKIMNLIGQEINLITSDSKEYRLNVLDTEISYSISGKKNIFIETDDLGIEINTLIHSKIYSL